MSQFWRSWFDLWCGSVLIFGAVLCGGAFEASSGPIRLLLSRLHGGGDITFDPALRFSLALMGAVSIGWGVTMIGVIRAAIAFGDAGRPLWLAVCAGVGVWFVIDSALSVATGFGMNAAINIVLVAIYVVGLLGSRALRRAA